jgi:gas vesicle protein
MADSGKFWGGLLIGSAIGAAAGILLTPRSGKETRRKLIQSGNKLTADAQYHADRLTDKLGDRLSEITESAQRTIGDTTERMQEAIAAGQEASRRLSQELKMANPLNSLSDPTTQIEEELP